MRFPEFLGDQCNITKYIVDLLPVHLTEPILPNAVSLLFSDLLILFMSGVSDRVFQIFFANLTSDNSAAKFYSVRLQSSIVWSEDQYNNGFIYE